MKSRVRKSDYVFKAYRMVLIGKRTGQLGNRLFVFAHFIANAIEYGYSIQNPGFYSYSRYFEGTRNNFFCRYPAKKTLCTGSGMQAAYYLFINKLVVPLSRLLGAMKAGRIRYLDIRSGNRSDEDYDLTNPEYIRLATSSNLLVINNAWLCRDCNNLARHADTVRAFFKPLKQHAASVAALVATARKDCDMLVGIHIRHGDYRRWQGGKYFFTASEYADVMKRFAATMPGKRVRFLICSNEQQDEQNFEGLHYVMGNNQMIEDMYAFAQCDALIGPPSTYTGWASFYGSVPLYALQSSMDTLAMADFQISRG